MGINEVAAIDLQINMANRLMEDVVSELQIDVKNLLQFSYELLKIDCE